MNTSPAQGQLPLNFYRVQHQRSFTIHNETGFESKGHYYMPLSFWVNHTKLEKHLDWSDSSIEPSPFISVFDNEDNALARAKFHQKQKRKKIFIAQISAQSLTPTVLEIEFADETVHLPAWENRGIGALFISTADVRRYLRVQVAIS
ncbi:hypothetical protein QBC39DRAFT_359897 [Podospora conica]|nr:hypothetical protein QBC39DRAFT_359897 [Schizothecium conicum]